MSFSSLFIVAVYSLKFTRMLKNFTQSSMSSAREIYAHSHMQLVIQYTV